MADNTEEKTGMGMDETKDTDNSDTSAEDTDAEADQAQGVPAADLPVVGQAADQHREDDAGEREDGDQADEGLLAHAVVSLGDDARVVPDRASRGASASCHVEVHPFDGALY